MEGTYKAHGEAGAKFVDSARKALGLPDEHYFVSDEVYDYFAGHKKKLLADYARWEKIYGEWRQKNPEKAKLLDDGIARNIPKDLLSQILEFPKDAKLATRKDASEELKTIAKAVIVFMSGSADLHGSTNYIEGGKILQRNNPAGATFGRNSGHGMCDSERAFLPRIFRASVRRSPLTDYCRPSIRSRPCRSCLTFTFSRTIRSGSAKTARPMNRWRRSALSESCPRST